VKISRDWHFVAWKFCSVQNIASRVRSSGQQSPCPRPGLGHPALPLCSGRRSFCPCSQIGRLMASATCDLPALEDVGPFFIQRSFCTTCSRLSGRCSWSNVTRPTSWKSGPVDGIVVEVHGWGGFLLDPLKPDVACDARRLARGHGAGPGAAPVRATVPGYKPARRTPEPSVRWELSAVSQQRYRYGAMRSPSSVRKKSMASPRSRSTFCMNSSCQPLPRTRMQAKTGRQANAPRRTSNRRSLHWAALNQAKAESARGHPRAAQNLHLFRASDPF